MNLKDGWYYSGSYPKHLLAVRSGAAVMWFRIDVGAQFGIIAPSLSQADLKLRTYESVVFSNPYYKSYDRYRPADFRYDLDPTDEWANIMVLKL